MSSAELQPLFANFQKFDTVMLEAQVMADISSDPGGGNHSLVADIHTHRFRHESVYHLRKY